MVKKESKKLISKLDNFSRLADNPNRMKNQKVSCIIPAYNEEKTITAVVKTCLQTEEISEVIVVNDGSKDNTLKKLKPFEKQIKIINLIENKGKGYAVSQGIKAAKYPFLLFLDGDLINLKPHHLFSLIKPVIDNKADITIGTFVTPSSYYYNSWPFSGQRCLKKKDIFPLTEQIKKTRYGLEIFLNEKLKKKRVIIIPMVFATEYNHLRKSKKQKDWLYAYVKEMWDIFQQTITAKSSSYKEQVKKEFIKTLSDYLKINYQKLKEYLLEE